MNISDNVLEFYVVDDLNSNEPFTDYFDDLKTALNRFHLCDSQSGKMPALGVYQEGNHLDLIHCMNGEDVLVEDYKKKDILSFAMQRAMNNIEDVVYKLVAEEGVRFKYNHSVLPWRDCDVAVVAPANPDFVSNSYCNDKILKAGDGIPATSINEVFVNGEGWISYQDLLTNPLEYANKGVLKIERVNVAYVKDDKFIGVDGQMDISVEDFENMAEKINKPYYISVADIKNSRFGRGNFAIMSFDTLSEAVKVWYDVNEKTEFTPGVMGKKEKCCVFNGSNEKFEEITYEEAAEIYGFDKIDNVENVIQQAVVRSDSEYEENSYKQKTISDINVEKN